jgi:hypothetical protein
MPTRHCTHQGISSAVVNCSRRLILVIESFFLDGRKELCDEYIANCDFGRSLAQLFTEHGKTTLRCLTGGLVLHHIPVLLENPILYSNYVRHNPVPKQAEARVSPVQDDKGPCGHNRSPTDT